MTLISCTLLQRIQIQTQIIALGGSYQLLYHASKCDKDGVLEELEKGVSPNLADYEKRTALHLAACEGCTDVVELLLEKGADVNSIDHRGRTVSSMNKSRLVFFLRDIFREYFFIHFPRVKC